jgi:phosphate-selective porin OprO/OprP
MNKENFLGNRIAAAVAVTLLCAAGPVSGQDASRRVEDLEKAVRDLSREIEALKEADAKAAETTRKADTQVPTVVWREGVQFNDPQGNWSLRIFGRGQLDYRQFEPDAAADTFAIRRARLGASINFMTDYGLTIEGEYATGSAQGTTTQGTAITNAYMDFNWFRKARIRAGQFKPQFGLENTASANFSDFQERGLTQNLIQNLNYDRGIMVYGAPIKGLNYGITASNGTGLNLEERQGSPQELDADGKLLTARLTADFAQFLNIKDALIHIGGSYKTGSVVNTSASPFTAATGQTEGRGVTFFNPEAFAAAAVEASNVDRTLSVGELAVARKSVKLQGEYWEAQYEGIRTTVPETPFNRKIEAGYISALWLITGESYSDSYSNGIFGRIRPRNNFSMEDGGGWGAWEAGLRYSYFDASDFDSATTGVPNTGRVSTTGTGTTASTPTQKADALTLGLKWMPNPYTRLMVNYTVTEFDTPIVVNGISMDEEKALTLRAQIDF